MTGGLILMKPKENIDFSKIVDSVIKVQSFNIKSSKNNLFYKIQPKVSGQWDALRLEQVVVHLLTNALKYGEGKPVSIILEATCYEAILRVIDHGIGISEDKLSTIFNRFERASPEHGYKGLGLGLWIVKETVRAMGGTIRVKSELGKGSEFVVILPKKPNYSQMIAGCAAK
jgi:signal transduction histidine kinase